MIRLENVSYGYGDVGVLHGVSVEFAAGAFTALIGPNGAGKSTMLRIASGELLPDSGMALFDGKSMREWKPRDLAVRRAFLPQSSLLDFSFSVEEVAMMGRAPHVRGSETDDDVGIVRSALEMSDMVSFSARDYTALSGGERQRAQLARVLAQVWARKGCALLLDEPVASLDPSHRHRTLAIAREWARAGACVVAILHDMNLALAYADKVVVLQRGKIVADGPVREVLEPELIGNVFGVRAEVLQNADGGRFIATSPLD